MSDIVQDHCNHCGPGVNHDVVYKFTKSDSEVIKSQFEICWADIFTVLKCRGCNSVKIKHEDWFSEDTDDTGNPIVNKRYYPSAIFRKTPTWLGSLDNEWHITKLLKEIYSALQNDAPSLAAMGVRAVLESVMIDKLGDQGTFSKNLNKFLEEGYISKTQLVIFKDALELGHASIHRGYIPKADQVIFALDLMESIVHHLYLLEAQAKSSVKGIPPKLTNQ
ncbi:MAG: DUF4145 domain-containing protein [Candidatus Scalindua sp.]|nr:DUF4145 domain-containing protein [Candidatus Scalindua sp.]MCR4343383.1 DUF4145 domain-containing protein [Candidatus Scalindua sp.]